MRRPTVSFLLAFLFLVVGCKDKSIQPSDLDFHNKILFTSSRTGAQQQYMMNPDGSNVVQITSGQYEHSNGRWSPDARKIACNTSEQLTTAGIPIVVFNVDGSGRKIIALGSNMSWSPDGIKIAYAYSPLAEQGVDASHIYVVNADGSGRVQLTTGDLRDDSPCWSPDGSELYFLSDRHNPGKLDWDTYVMNADGTGIKRITVTANGWTAIRDISADGRTMLVVSTRSGVFPYATYTMSVDTLTTTLVIQPPKQEVYNFPRWSPDEKAIIFLGAMVDGSAKQHVYKFVIGATNVSDLVPGDYTAGFPDWSK